jgi:hypothetical protein
MAPFISALENRNESPLLRDALPRLTEMARVIGADLQVSTVKWRLRLPGQPQGNLQSWHDPEHP